LKTIFNCILLVLLAVTTVRGDPFKVPEEYIDPSSLLSYIRFDSQLDFCKEEVPIENPEIRERLDKELLISLGNRHQIILWLKRSGRFMPYIEIMLRQNGMPEDLKYVAVAESALRPHVGSPKGAMGFWQFIKSTGQKYGLTINSDIDERRNLFLSTEAAIRYLKELYNIFGSWTLAAAAYNMGEEGLESSILDQEVKDYYKLYLSIETSRYIFRIIAAKMVLSDPEKYGFHLQKADLYTPLEFDCIEFQCPGKTPLKIIAQAANTYFKIIKDLNPEIRRNYLPKGIYSILIPKGSSDGFHARYETAYEKWLAEGKKHIYFVKKGDNLSLIANRFDVPLLSLFTWNELAGKKIYPGNRLVIYPNRIESVKQ
jgi:membrane-bound lytic murein transglycosylase D